MIIYVNALASGNGNGSCEFPFRTIEEAQLRIREIKNTEGLPDGGITVSVAAGEYRYAYGLCFTQEDSGTESCPITYLSEKKHGALLNGGVHLKFSDFEPLSADEKSKLYDPSASEKVLKLDLKKYGVTTDDIGKLYSNGSHVTADMYPDGTGDGETELFVNGSRMTLARYPNEDYLHTGTVIDEGGVSHDLFSKKENCSMRGGTFLFDSETAKHVVSWHDVRDIWTFGYFKYNWEDSTIRVSNLNTEENSLTLEHHCMFGIKENARYYFFNVFEELDAEGEYYIDRENCILYFYPPKGCEASDIFITLSTNSILTINGASFVTFKDFAIAYTRNDAVKINGGFDKYNTWSNRIRPRLENAVDGKNITVDGCKIFAVRESAVFGHGENITIKNCEIFNIGTNGIYLSGGNRATLEKSGNMIYNNLIRDWSQYVFTYCAAVGIQGCGTTVSHNEMYNCPHFAVLYLGNDHVIEYNKIHHVCLDTDDCAAIYSGRSYSDVGTVIRYNYIHDVGQEPGDDGVGVNAEGIYFDDNMSGQIAYGNILADISGRAFLLGGGRDIVCQNNVIVNCRISIHYDIRGYDGVFENGWYGNFLKRENPRELVRLSYVPYREKLWSEKYPHLAQLKIDPDTCSNDDPDLIVNPSYSTVKNNIVYTGKRACDVDIHDRVRAFSSVEEPVFLDNIEEDFPGFSNGDFTMSKDSKIRKILSDFDEIPFDKIGITE